MVGATSTRRPARGTRPSLRTPLPAITNGARACTMPKRAVLAAVTALVLPVVGGGVQHAQVGRGGMVEQLRDVVVRERVGVGRRASGADRRARRRGRRAGRATGRRAGRAPVTAGALVAVGPGAGAAERDRARRRSPPRRCRRARSTRRVTMSTIGASRGSSSTSSARSRSLTPRTLPPRPSRRCVTSPRRSVE